MMKESGMGPFIILLLFVLAILLFAYKKMHKKPFETNAHGYKDTYPFLEIVTGILLTGMLVIPVWLFHFIPFQDTGNHLYIIYVHSHIDSPFFSKFFMRQDGSTTNLLFYYFVETLAKVTSLDFAHRLFVSISIAGWVWAAWFLAGSVNRARAWYGFLVAPFAWNWELTMGFYNFSITVPLFAVGMGLLLRNPKMPIRIMVWVGIVAIITATAHPLGALALWVAAFGIADNWEKRLRVVVMMTPSVILILAGSKGLVAYGLNWPGSFIPFPYVIWALVSRMSLPLSKSTGFVTLPLLTFFLANVIKTLSTKKGRTSPVARAVLFLVLLTLVLPLHALHNFYIGVRMPLFCLVLLPVWLDFGERMFNPKIVALLSLGLTLILSVQVFLEGTKINKDIEEYTSGIKAVKEGGDMLPMVFHFSGHPGLMIEPLRHAWGYYGIAKNLAIPYIFNADPEHPRSVVSFVKKDILPAFPPEDAVQKYIEGDTYHTLKRMFGKRLPIDRCFRLIEDNLVSSACKYDQVLTWGAPQEFIDRLSTCQSKVFSHKRLIIWRRKVKHPRSDKVPKFTN